MGHQAEALRIGDAARDERRRFSFWSLASCLVVPR
jgi:hypothetical protein